MRALIKTQSPFNYLKKISQILDEENEVSNMLDSLSHFYGASPIKGIGNSDFSPLLDLVETGNEYQLNIELPGTSKEDIKININDSILVVEGEKKETKTQTLKEKFVNERFYGKFHREISLQKDCDPSNITASFNSGILTIKIPKLETTQKTTTSIQIE